MDAGNLDLDDRMQAFINWYQQARHELASESYYSSATGLKSVVEAYKDWTSSSVLRAEVRFQTRALDEFNNIFAGVSGDELKAYLPQAVLALKNRGEFLSEKADFYPVFGTTIVFLTAVVSTLAPPFMKLVLGCLAGFFILLGAFKHRVLLRARSAHVKELANLLDFIKVQVGLPKRASKEEPSLACRSSAGFLGADAAATSHSLDSAIAGEPARAREETPTAR